MVVAFVLKGYPRLSETFIAQEIRSLERRGLKLRLFSLRHPTDKKTHPITAEIKAPVVYLPEYLHHEPFRVLHAWWQCRKRKNYSAIKAIWQRDFERDNTRNRVRRFGQALVLANELPSDVTALHFHFLHTPASVTRYAAMLLDLPFTGSAHAKDIWTIPEWEKVEKLDDIKWLTTCTSSGADHLRSLSSDTAGKVHLDYHGLDLQRFPSPNRYTADNADVSDQPVRILSVGRAVEKKGYGDLLKALQALPKELDWSFHHIGGGPLLSNLREEAENLGIAGRITWHGAQSQEDVLNSLREADIFVLASKIAGDGDRDGLPNVLMEAQSQQVAVVSTSVSAIPELIADGETGLLVPPDDPPALSQALDKLITDRTLRQKLALAGEVRVREQFDATNCINEMAERFLQEERPAP